MTTNEIRVETARRAGQWLAEWYAAEIERQIEAKPDVFLNANTQQIELLREGVARITERAHDIATQNIDRDCIWYPVDHAVEMDGNGDPRRVTEAIRFAAGALAGILINALPELIDRTSRTGWTRSPAAEGLRPAELQPYWAGALELPELLKELLKKYPPAVEVEREQARQQAEAVIEAKRTEALEKWRAA